MSAHHRLQVRRGAVATVAVVAVVVSALATIRPAVPANEGGAGLEPAVDPATWSAVSWTGPITPFRPGAEPGHDRISGLAVTRSGLLAWGRMAAPGRNQFNDVAAVFLSGDGGIWSAGPLVADVGLADTAEIRTVVDGPAGLLAFGSVCCTREEPALWRSQDGERWERLAFPEAIANGQVAAATATRDRYVAVGRAAEGTAAIWTSADGIRWDRADAAEGVLPLGMLADVEPSATGLVAVGHADGATYDGIILTSPDGTEWSPFPGSEAFVGELDTMLHGVVPFGDGTLVLGLEGDHAERVRCEQMGALEGLVASVGRLAPRDGRGRDFSCGWGSDTRWIDDGSGGWQPMQRVRGAQPARGELIEFRLIEAVGTGLVAIGEGADDGFPSLFVSGDGRGWRRLAAVGGFAPGETVTGFAVAANRIVAVGEDWDPRGNAASVPAVWVGELR